MKIFKYPFEIDIVVKVDMPKGASVIFLDMQGRTPCIWAKVDPRNPTEERQYYVLGTGWDVPKDAGGHVGSLQDGFVYHVFEKIGREATSGDNNN